MSLLKRDKDPVLEKPKPRGNGERVPGVLASEAVEQHCESAAKHVEGLGLEVITIADSFNAECKALADNLRNIAELEKARTAAFYANVRDAVQSVQEARRTFEKRYHDAADKVVTAVAAPAEAMAAVEKELSAIKESPGQ